MKFVPKNETEDDAVELEEMTVEYIKKSNEFTLDRNAVYSCLFTIDYDSIDQPDKIFIEQPFTYYQWVITETIQAYNDDILAD